jgi:hypothetical protein
VIRPDILKGSPVFLNHSQLGDSSMVEQRTLTPLI